MNELSQNLHYKTLEIRNFRGIGNKKVKLELSPITALLGGNNSGKSTILEALFLAPNPLRDVPYITPHKYRTASNVIFSLHKTLDYIGFTFLFHNYTSDMSEIELDINGEIYSLKFIRIDDSIHIITNKNVGRIIQSHEKKFRSIGYLPVHEIAPTIYHFKPIVKDTLLISANLTKMGYEYLKRNWGLIINKGIMRKVARDISTLTQENYMDFTMEPIVAGRLDLLAYLRDGRRIRIGDLGEGIQSYISARILYEEAQPAVLLWDDIESHLNPRILLHIANWFSELLDEGKQIVFSTHSLEAVRIIAGVNEEETGIYLTSLDNSVLRARRLTLEEVEDYQKSGIDVRTAEAVLL